MSQIDRLQAEQPGDHTLHSAELHMILQEDKTLDSDEPVDLLNDFGRQFAGDNGPETIRALGVVEFKALIDLLDGIDGGFLRAPCRPN